ncbi:MRN complex-interacting protein [Anopheles marshallii]|uniref:MRN complex-interacting protein n=1 Tax=Anopheles marshallii TaxID=1521116 RepID=UPI00237A59A8|nr:MRN complex-interacting protein [Anopheles marshallii]
MPQELRVVRCFQCLKYQVDIVKKANKWVCKLCGVKQSLAREFFRGTGKDCRSMVQQLSMRKLEMDQQEAEITKLVLQNKIQLSKPPLERDPRSPIAARNEAPQGPSKWETFLTKETNDDLSDTICSLESLESVSSTTFDRERINKPVNNVEATGTKEWNYQRTKKEHLFDNEERWSTNLDKDPSPRSNWAIGQKKPMLNPIRTASNAKINTFFKNTGANKRSIDSSGNESMALPSFHHKESTTKRTFPNPTRNTFSQANTAPKTSSSETPSSSRSNKSPEMPCKRKFSNVFATPLMNFGKRTVVESKLAPSVESLANINEMKSQTETKPTTVSSKWAKYLPEDDVTNENTDNVIMF